MTGTRAQQAREGTAVGKQDVDVGALVVAERERLVRLCGHLSGSAEAAEDLAHETMIEAYRNAHKLHDPRRQAQWLWAIARHVCLRWTRHHGREAARLTLLPDAEEVPASLIATDDVEAELTREELVRLLDWALGALPAPTRGAGAALCRGVGAGPGRAAAWAEQGGRGNAPAPGQALLAPPPGRRPGDRGRGGYRRRNLRGVADNVNLVPRVWTRQAARAPDLRERRTERTLVWRASAARPAWRSSRRSIPARP